MFTVTIPGNAFQGALVNQTPNFLRLRFANLNQVSAILQAQNVQIADPNGHIMNPPYLYRHSEGLEIIFS